MSYLFNKIVITYQKLFNSIFSLINESEALIHMLLICEQE